MTSSSIIKVGEYYFDKECPIGKGSFPKVHKALHENEKDIFALNIIQLKDRLFPTRSEYSWSHQRKSCWKDGWFLSNREELIPYIVLEYYSGGTLRELLKIRKTLDEEEDCYVLKHIASLFIHHSATNACGEPLQLVHRDINRRIFYSTKMMLKYVITALRSWLQRTRIFLTLVERYCIHRLRF